MATKTADRSSRRISVTVRTDTYAHRQASVLCIRQSSTSSAPPLVSSADVERGIRHTVGGVLRDLERATVQHPALDGFSPVLGWSHYRLLMNVEHEAERRFHEIEAERGPWPVQHLERQIHARATAPRRAS